jgi:hypothetical protein
MRTTTALFVSVLAYAWAMSASSASVFDEDAIPSAGAQQQLEIDSCVAASRANPAMTMHEAVLCVVSARQHFAAAIHLKKMDLFNVYAARMALMAGQYDAKLISTDEANAQWKTISDDYENSLAAAYQADVRRQAAVRDFFQRLGRGLQGASRAMSHSQSPTINCTSYQMGTMVQTNCHQ